MPVLTAATAENPMLTAALRYAALGRSVIPLLARDKRPAIKWQEFQSRRATEEEIRGWWRQWPNANIGIVTGKISNLVVIDIDGEQGIAWIKSVPDFAKLQTPVVKTGKGFHFYLSHPGEKTSNFAGREPGVDFRGDGGYVAAPPSVHPSGALYQFQPGFDESVDAAPAPAAVVALLTKAGAAASSNVLNFAEAPRQRTSETAPVDKYVASAVDREIGRVTAADEGTRNGTLNEAAFSLGQFVGAGQATKSEVERRLLMAATRSGLPEREARATIESGLTAGIQQPRDLSEVGNKMGPREQVRFVSEALAAEDQAPAKPAGGPVFSIGNFRLDRLTEGEAPARKWLVTGAFPLSVATVVFGPGGVSKSMSILDLGLKVATREKAGVLDPESFLGPIPKAAAGAAVYITLEDDKAEIHRRVAALDQHGWRAGAPFYVFSVLDMPSFDPTMVRQEGRSIQLTRFAVKGLEELIETVAADCGQPVRMVAIDPAGDLLDGSEDDAANVKPLMRRLREIASRHRCTVILVGHSAKGQVDGDSIADRGMRGSGAWVANSRGAFGLWRPASDDAARLLRKLDIPVTSENIERVICGRLTKSNAPSTLTGVRHFLKNQKTGLLDDVTGGLRNLAQEEAEVSADLLIQVVAEAAMLRMPFQLGGKAGLHERRADLPAPLSNFGDKKLRALGNAAVDAGRIVKCRAAGSSSPTWLDVPGGPYATGLEVRMTYGSLSEARKAQRGAE